MILNVGGTIHQVKWDTIDKFPNSRLQRLRYATTESKIIIIINIWTSQHYIPLYIAEILSLCDSFCLVSREFYFDRSPRVFENILGLYRKGELHLTESVCPKDFVGELEYWGLSALYLEPCCAYTLQVKYLTFSEFWMSPQNRLIIDIDLVINCKTNSFIEIMIMVH